MGRPGVPVSDGTAGGDVVAGARADLAEVLAFDAEAKVRHRLHAPFKAVNEAVGDLLAGQIKERVALVPREGSGLRLRDGAPPVAFRFHPPWIVTSGARSWLSPG